MEDNQVGKQHSYFVYILANKRNGTLYTGVTNNLLRRVTEHKEKVIKGFTSEHGIDKLVYFEAFNYVYDAIARETCIKRWKREWRLRLIENENKTWRDLYYDLTDEEQRKFLKEEIHFIEKDGFYSH